MVPQEHTLLIFISFRVFGFILVGDTISATSFLHLTAHLNHPLPSRTLDIENMYPRPGCSRSWVSKKLIHLPNLFL